MDRYFSIPELAEAASITPPGFRKKYKDQIPHWQNRLRIGSRGGGGKEYIAKSLPIEIQEALVRSGLLESVNVSVNDLPQTQPENDPNSSAIVLASESQLTTLQSPINDPETIDLIGRMSPVGDVVEVVIKTRAPSFATPRQDLEKRAWLEIFQVQGQWCAAQQVSRRMDCDLAFADAYNAGTVRLSDYVHQLYPKLSRSTIARYRSLRTAEGADAMIRRWDGSRGRATLDANHQLREFCLALIRQRPDIGPSHLHRVAAARFGQVPSRKAFERWLNGWRASNPELLTLLSSPDEWKNKYKLAFGSYSEKIDRPNQLWMLDSTPADIMTSEGRYCLIACVDVFTRRAKLLAVKTSRSSAIALLLRQCILEWGVPEAVKTDNGKDYASQYIERVLSDLRVQQIFCTPFTPEQKPYVERFFKTFSHDALELLPGFLGHCIKDRQAIRARYKDSERAGWEASADERAYPAGHLTPKQLQAFCDLWLQAYHQRPHRGLNGRSPMQALADSRYVKRVIDNERALDLLLAPAPQRGGIRTVLKDGIHVDDLEYIGVELADHANKQIRVLYDPTDIGRIYCYELEGGFIGIAYNPEYAGMADRASVATAAVKRQKRRLREAKQALKQAGKSEPLPVLVDAMLQAQALPSASDSELALPQAIEVHALPAFEAAVVATDAAKPHQPDLSDAAVKQGALDMQEVRRQRQQEAEEAARQEQARPWDDAEWLAASGRRDFAWTPELIEKGLDYCKRKIGENRQSIDRLKQAGKLTNLPDLAWSPVWDVPSPRLPGLPKEFDPYLNKEQIPYVANALREQGREAELLERFPEFRPTSITQE